ncbi:MAG: hypothetical protein K2X72_38950 [Reyranella sp.]|nr:hypothetical protein [Reyranella sp.]
MKRGGSMRGVHTDNDTAEMATKRRRAAIGEEAALGNAYRKDQRLCLHVPFARFRNIVRALAQRNGVSIGAAASAWVADWSKQANQLAKNQTRPQSKICVLPDGTKVFYGN